MALLGGGTEPLEGESAQNGWDLGAGFLPHLASLNFSLLVRHISIAVPTEQVRYVLVKKTCISEPGTRYPACNASSGLGATRRFSKVVVPFYVPTSSL